MSNIFVAQINPIVGDIAGNTEKILKMISRGKSLGADLVLFSEMAITGYPPEDFLLLPHFIEDVETALQKIINYSIGIAVVVGTVRLHLIAGEKPLCNSAAIIENGKLLGFQDKMLLPTYDVFDELRFFEPARETKVWDICGRSVGVTICEDIWQQLSPLKYTSYKRNPIEELARLNPDFVLNLSASPFSLREDIPHSLERLAACRSVVSLLKCPLILCNQVGANDSLIFDGHSLALDEKGNLVAEAKGFKEDELFIDLLKKNDPLTKKIEPMLELYQALVLGVRDYFFKSGFKKACLGISGGIDSALVACIAVEALGQDNVLGVLMPSRYSSEGSITDAIALSLHLGIKTETISIEEPFQQFIDTLSPVFKGNRKNSLTEENMQARIRGLLLMAISNEFGAIVLSTGNKSELAMGYATLYGDMCGGLAVINDLTKAQVYTLSRWINREKEIIPWNSITKEPSAELRPDQKDSDSLPAYEVIDHVLQGYIEDHQSSEEIVKRFGFAKELVDDLIRRIHMNEFKRRQGAPGLRVSEKAFSVGRRFPIVQKYVS